MTITSKKKSLFSCFLWIITSLMVTSCGAKKKDRTTTLPNLTIDLPATWNFSQDYQEAPFTIEGL